MSSPDTHAAAHDAHEDAQNKFWIFVQLAMMLAVITGLELVTVYLPFVAWLLITVLVTLSTIKFMLVIFYFMHLKWDKVLCTILFFIGLTLASGTMWALLRLFGAEASKPLDTTMLNPPAVAASHLV